MILLDGNEKWQAKGDFLFGFEVETAASLQLFHDAYSLPQADTMLTASATQNCGASLCWVNRSSLEGCYLEKQDMGRLSSHSGGA